MDIQLCALDNTLHEQVRIESFVIERDGLESLHSSPHSDPLTLVVREVQRTQAVIRDAGENSLRKVSQL